MRYVAVSSFDLETVYVLNLNMFGGDPCKCFMILHITVTDPKCGSSSGNEELCYFYFLISITSLLPY